MTTWRITDINKFIKKQISKVKNFNVKTKELEIINQRTCCWVQFRANMMLKVTSPFFQLSF